MGKRLLIYLTLFVLVLLVNVQLSNAILHNRHVKQSTNKLLSEIGGEDNKNNQFGYSSSPLILGVYEAKAVVSDARVVNLKTFFRKYNSPLYDNAEKIVEVSDTYQFDYRLLPAIAMQESNLCKYIPENSYNCWGWGIYGDLTTRFTSYDEGIETVAEGIKTHYIDHGLVTASAIMAKYTPSSNGSWAFGVNTFLNALE
ncbi:MAG: hypothetical protein Q7S61_03900 [bacterium]|nr:hypothetical protein [bacterium]